jgi:hypothetical protein
MKFGVILSNGQQRKALPIIEAANESEALLIVVMDYEEGDWLMQSIRDITDFPLWNNCLYSGLAVGHTVGQCTANACY